MAMTRQEIRWVLKAQSGDRKALEALLKAVQEPLYRYIADLIGDTVAAEDILQEVFILIYRKLPWLKQPEYFRHWTYRIASREAFRTLKRERRRAERLREMKDLPPPPARDEMTPELRGQLHRLIDQVSSASRAALILHYLHELSLQEVADVLGITAGTAKSRVAYGLTTLRKLMGGAHDTADCGKT